MNEQVKERVLKRLESLIERGEAVLRTYETSDFVIGASWVDTEEFAGWRDRSLVFLTDLLGAHHVYTQSFRQRVASHSGSADTESGIGILRAVREDVTDGYFTTIRELIHADVFSDFLDMAGYLLSEGYKDPAAVLTGGVLEEHLRQLCKKNGIDIDIQQGASSRPKKADGLNSDLARAQIYSVSDQKAITSWLDLRNLAAHGKYSDYSGERVGLFIMGVREFIARIPA